MLLLLPSFIFLIKRLIAQIRLPEDKEHYLLNSCLITGTFRIYQVREDEKTHSIKSRKAKVAIPARVLAMTILLNLDIFFSYILRCWKWLPLLIFLMNK